MVTRYVLEVLYDGIGKQHRTSVFPCGIFQVKTGINRKPGDPNYDLFRLALKCTAKRLYPNYANCDWSVQVAAIDADRQVKANILRSLSDEQLNQLVKFLTDHPDQLPLLGLKFEDGQIQLDFSVSPLEEMGTMGCRTWNGYDINFKETYIRNIETVLRGELLPEYVQTSGIQKDGRGNICPVTIILPELAMLAKKANPNNVVEEFMHILDKKIHDAKDILIERYEWMCSQSAKAAKFMYENNTMCGYIPEEGIRSALKHGTLVIGQLGLAEALQILIGCDHTDPKGMELAKKIEQLYKDRCAEYKSALKLNFGVYYTPSESLSYTALKRFRDKYGIIPKVSDKDWFTNSMH